jgi:hypothetical protein
MTNKTNALNKIEDLKGALNNLKSSAYRGSTNELGDKFDRVNSLLEDLETMISVESDDSYGRGYNGI